MSSPVRSPASYKAEAVVFAACRKCGVGAGEPCVVRPARGKSSTSRRLCTPHQGRPLIEDFGEVMKARAVLDDRMDVAGLADQFELAGAPVVLDGDVTFTVRITITTLDIECGPRRE